MLDARTDLFSFGAVLYEMPTGRQAFSGKTTAVIFDAVFNRLPVPPSRINPEIPPELELTLNRLLEKDRDLRCQHASEVRAELKRVKRDTGLGWAELTIIEVGAIHQLPPLPIGTRPGSSDSQVIAALVNRHKKTLVIGLAAIVVISGALGYWLMPPLAPSRVSNYVQLTHDGAAKDLVGTAVHGGKGSGIHFSPCASVGYGRKRISNPVSLTGHGASERLSRRVGAAGCIRAWHNCRRPSMGLADPRRLAATTGRNRRPCRGVVPGQE